MIQEIGLSIVNACNANCAFCPRDMVPTKGKKMMPLQLVKKIVKEITSEDFKSKHQLSHIIIGENGEPTLHKELIPILREIKKVGVQVSLFTNFSNMDKERAKIIVAEKLVGSINTNIDGNTPETYKLMKGLDFVKTMSNLENFLSIEGREAIPLYIHCVTAEIYTKAVKQYFGKVPRKMKAAPAYKVNEHRQIQARFANYQNVHCHPDSTLMWAERFDTQNKNERVNCWNIGRVKSVAFINPDGEWYLCCFDMGNEQVLGDLNVQTFDEIYNGEKRLEILKKLENGEFESLGSPCNRVDCCQVIPWG